MEIWSGVHLKIISGANPCISFQSATRARFYSRTVHKVAATSTFDAGKGVLGSKLVSHFVCQIVHVEIVAYGTP